MKKAFLLEIADAVAKNGAGDGVAYDQWLEHMTGIRNDLQHRLAETNRSIEKALASKRQAQEISALLKTHAETLPEES